MMSEFSWDLIAMAVVSPVAFLAIGIPYWRGLCIALLARSATRTLCEAELHPALDGPVRTDEPLALVLLRVLDQSLRDNDQGESLNRLFQAYPDSTGKSSWLAHWA